MAEIYEISILSNVSSSSSGWSNDFRHGGGPLYMSIQGTFDGAGVVLQASYDDGVTWGTATDIITGNTVAISAGSGVDGTAYSAFLNVPVGLFRVSGTSIGATTALSVTLNRIV